MLTLALLARALSVILITDYDISVEIDHLCEVTMVERCEFEHGPGDFSFNHFINVYLPGTYGSLTVSGIDVEGPVTWSATKRKSSTGHSLTVRFPGGENATWFVLRYHVSLPYYDRNLNVSVIPAFFYEASSVTFSIVYPDGYDVSDIFLNCPQCWLALADRTLTGNCSNPHGRVWAISPFPRFFVPPSTAQIVFIAVGIPLFLGLCAFFGWWVHYHPKDCVETKLLPMEFTRLLLTRCDPIQALLYLAALGRLTLVCDGPDVSVTDV
jgi:hypothetical protein